MRRIEGCPKLRKKRPLARLIFCGLGLSFLLSLWPARPLAHGRQISPESPESSVRWYSIHLGQETVGYIKETGTRVQQGGGWQWRSITETKIVLKRLGQKVEMTVNYEHLETEDGLLRKIIAEQVLGSSRVRTEIEIKEDRAEIKTVSSGQTFQKSIPYTGPLLGPVGIGRLTLEKLKSPGDKVEYRTILAELSQVVSGERTLVGEEEVDCGRRKIKARKVLDRLSPEVSTREVWLDAEGNEVRSVDSTPLGELVTCLSSEQEVMEALALSRGQEQYFASTLITANLRLPQARQLERVVIRLRHRKPEMGWPEIENEYQKILEKDDGTMVVELRSQPLKGRSTNRVPEAQLKPYLEANAFIDFKQPEIERVAARVAGSEKDVFKKALKLRDWVSQKLTFDPGFVFAPASEVMRDKKATCAGYASLLTALLRAAGIPARYLMGLAYVNGIWGGHAWVEAWLDGRWLPLDAALPSPGAADAARLVIARSSLENGPGESLVAVQKLFGYVTIDVLEYSLLGRKFSVSEGQPRYEIKEGHYWNYGLQLGLRAPAGFTWAELDKVWPDRTLLTLKGPAGQTISLIQESWFPAAIPGNYLIDRLKKEVNGGKLDYIAVWGKKRSLLVSRDKAAVVVANGVDIFLLVARGQESEKLLRRVLSGLETRLVLN
ncbi:MAG: transglutaminase-like domain-containing protein [Candidatus Saccharicenans sp.]|uniref:transglutaminase-like domain-containing protein n=1 Tax=Candidatus Saccharicenans sp. TaxID=2819258 RepID=UPI00404AEB0A